MIEINSIKKNVDQNKILINNNLINRIFLIFSINKKVIKKFDQQNICDQNKIFDQKF